MEIKEPLTNEKVVKKFKSQFELVSYAIKLAENMIKTGRGPRVEIDNQNCALQVIAEIAQGKDLLDEIVPARTEEAPVERSRGSYGSRNENSRESSREREPSSKSGTERKKSRKSAL